MFTHAHRPAVTRYAKLSWLAMAAAIAVSIGTATPAEDIAVVTERLADSYRREAAGSNPRRATMSAEAVLSTLENDGRWSDIAYESPEPRPPKFEPFRALSHLQRLHVLATAFSSAAPGPVCVHLAAGVPVHGPDVLDPDTCDRGDER